MASPTPPPFTPSDHLLPANHIHSNMPMMTQTQPVTTTNAPLATASSPEQILHNNNNHLNSLVIFLLFPSTFVILFLMFVLAFVSEYKPNTTTPPLFSVREATFSNFNYVNDTLNYSLTLQVAVSNITTIGFGYIDASVTYHDITLASQPVETFNQGSTGLNMLFEGQHKMALTTDQKLVLINDNICGVYHINVKLCPKLKPMVFRCDLKVPVDFRVPCEQFHPTECYDSSY